MKTEIFKNALELSAEELTEVAKIKEHINRIVEKDLILNHVKAGFSFLEVSVHTGYTDYTYRIMRVQFLLSYNLRYFALGNLQCQKVFHQHPRI